MRRPHVAVLAGIGSIGGAERSLLALIAAAASSIRFTVVLPERGDLTDAAVSSGASVVETLWSPRLLRLGEINGRYVAARMASVIPDLWRSARSLRSAVADIRPDVLITNGIKPHFVGALAAGPSMPPVVWYLRDSLEERRVSRTLLALLSKRSAGAIAISRYIASDATTYMDRARPVDVVYNIIDDSPSKSSTAPLPSKSSDQVWFATIGALTPLKGHDIFLRAAASVADQLPTARFLIVGAAAYRTEQGLGYERRLRELAEELGIARRTMFLGHRSDVKSLLSLIDVVVQSNRGPEGFGRSVAEALAAGVPVIASNRWSLPELVDDGRTGWLVPVGDVDGLAECLRRVGADRALRLEAGAHARVRATEQFSTTEAVARFESVVRRLMRGAPA